VPAEALLVFTPQDLRILRAIEPRRLVKIQKLFLSDVYLWNSERGAVAIAGPMLGAPQAVLVLEKLIVLGARRILVEGWCGGLNSDLAVGDLVLPQWTLSEEGTSAHYPVPPADVTPDPALNQRLRSILAGSGKFIIHQGGVWSTDAPYRETREKVESYRRDGLLAVEMECSALFTVARFRAVALAVCLVVSDDLSGREWRHGYGDKRFMETRKQLPPYLLDTLFEPAAP
jgi:uridine phosphorylase